MAATYDISITDLKVVIKTTSTGNTEIETFARDKHKAKLSESIIFISDINSSDDVFVFGDITAISTITNYREGASDSITVPVSIELLYTDVIEDVEAPFFFEALQVDAAGAVGVDVTTESIVNDLNSTARNTQTLEKILKVLKNIDKTLIKIRE
jgi:hypothetical protein